MSVKDDREAGRLPSMPPLPKLEKENRKPFFLRDDGDVRGFDAWCVCPGCDEQVPLTSTAYGNWDTGEKRPVLVKDKLTKKTKLIMVPIRDRGRVCAGCQTELDDFRHTRQAGVDRDPGKKRG